MYEDQLNGEFIWGHWGLKGEDDYAWTLTHCQARKLTCQDVFQVLQLLHLF